MGDAFLPRDASDKDHVGPVEWDTVSLERIQSGIGSVDVGVDAVVYDVHARWIHGRVGRQDIATHTVAHRDDRLSVVVGGPLHP